jgi:hypothetical protein
MADGASLIFGVLLGPAVRQHTEDKTGSVLKGPYAATCSSVASFLQVTYDQNVRIAREETADC